jgi:two-component system response regulator FixJ
MGSISHWGSSNDGHRLVYVANRTQIASDTIGALLAIEGLRTASGRSEAALFEALTSTIPDVVVLDESIGRNLGLGALAGLRRAYPRLPVILTMSDSGLGISAGALTLGAWELIVKPIDAERLLRAIYTALEWADDDRADGDGADRQWRHPLTR